MVLEIHFTSGAVMLSGAKHLSQLLSCAVQGSEILLPQLRDQNDTYEMVGSHSMKYDWREAGEEWSAPWGSSAAQWNGTIFPRIREFLPVGTILEIALRFWTVDALSQRLLRPTVGR